MSTSLNKKAYHFEVWSHEYGTLKRIAQLYLQYLDFVDFSEGTRLSVCGELQA